MKTAEPFTNGQKTLLEKEKLLVTSSKDLFCRHVKEGPVWKSVKRTKIIGTKFQLHVIEIDLHIKESFFL